MFDIVGPLMPQVRSGNAKAIVVTAKDRIPAAADVPTMAEQGVPDFVSGTWAGIIAPAGTPKEIVDRVSAEAKKALADMSSGDVLKVVATDPGSVRDFQAFARQTGNELLEQTSANDEFVHYLRRR
jgi:tripartite-type tricarboxylate transporter receptor subunit TctC